MIKVFRGKKVLAVIPARAGSKRLPNKNIRKAGESPIIHWSLKAAGEARTVDRIVVSTDDRKVMDVVANYDFLDTIKRPPHLATSTASMTSVLEHSLETLSNEGEKFEYLVLLQPTSPLRTAWHIDAAFEKVSQVGALGAVSVCPTEHPIEWMGKLGKDGSLDKFFAETSLAKQSQELGQSYQINGALYIVPVREFLTYQTLFLPTGMTAFVMSRQDSIDIDHEFDLAVADWLLTRRMTQ